ncbi:MAG: hypothetical protein DA328_01550 [Nitrososphaeraceae archaeon]|nr:hypothetical protein [Nitrososphaeraceae archaeon]
MIIYPLILNKNVSFVDPYPGEKLIQQEDCSEDELKTGFLTLTNKRLIFEKTEGTVATLSKKTSELLLNIPLNKIRSCTSEGFLIKKIVVHLITGEIYKFGVFSTKRWATLVNEQKNTFTLN